MQPYMPRYLDPLFSSLHNSRVRFLRWEDSTYVAVADNDGKELPDLCHHSQLTYAGRPIRHPAVWVNEQLFVFPQ
jgi:hypothetical protein